VVCAVGAVVAASLGSALGNPHGRSVQVKVVALSCAAMFVVLGALATRSAAGQLARVIGARAGSAAGAAVRLIALASGYLLTLLVGLGLLAVPVQHLLVGGALTGVLVGIAAQQALGNLFAEVGQSRVTRCRARMYSASTPSRQVSFLPSSRERAL